MLYCNNKNKSMYKIYVHTTPDGKKYVGCTSYKYINTRFRKGRGYLKSHNYLFYEAILHYGWDNIKHEVIETTDNKLVAQKLEEYYTLLWRTNEPEFGYNVKVVSSFGKRSEETCRKISEKLKGRHPSKETCMNISEKLKGKNTWTKGKHWKIVDGKRVWY